MDLFYEFVYWGWLALFFAHTVLNKEIISKIDFGFQDTYKHSISSGGLTEDKIQALFTFFWSEWYGEEDPSIMTLIKMEHKLAWVVIFWSVMTFIVWLYQLWH
jgi:hypothetical protein